MLESLLTLRAYLLYWPIETTHVCIQSWCIQGQGTMRGVSGEIWGSLSYINSAYDAEQGRNQVIRWFYPLELSWADQNIKVDFGSGLGPL